MLEDERKKYAEPEGPVKSEEKILGHIEEVTDEIREKLLDNDRKTKEFVIKEYGIDPDGLEMEIRNLQEREPKLTGGQTKIAKAAPPFDEITGEDFAKLRDQKQDGGDIDGQMTMLMMSKKPEEEMLPDDEMEDEYLDFILDEALDNEEEDYLMEMLQGNNRLSEIFDKVIDVAQEFAGSGPVEGPGSGVSDSIPARLSDGEFVFTAKAAKEIGADELMRMMKDAEANADARQGLAVGGEPEEEENVVVKSTDEPATQKIIVEKQTTDSSSRPIMDTGEKEISIALRRDMQDPSKKYVRS